MRRCASSRRCGGSSAAVSGGPYLVFSAVADARPRSPRLGARRSPADDDPTGAGGSRRRRQRLRIEVVRDPTQLEEFERTMVEAYPTVELAPFGSQARLFGEPLIDSGWTLYLGYEGDRVRSPPSAAYRHRHVVAVEMVSTRSECRGRGYGAAITARRRHDPSPTARRRWCRATRQRPSTRGSATCPSCATRCGWVGGDRY